MEQIRTSGTPAAYRRQKQIEDCLYENLQHTPYQSISVSDLCRQVGISRKAYYNYYRDKDACLSAIIDQQLRKTSLEVTLLLADNSTPLETATLILESWKRQKPFLDVLVRNDLLYLLMLRQMQYIMEEDTVTLALLDTPEIKPDADIVACYMSCQLTLVLQWYNRGFETPVEEMAKKLLRVLQKPLIPEASGTEGQ